MAFVKTAWAWLGPWCGEIPNFVQTGNSRYDDTSEKENLRVGRHLRTHVIRKQR